MVPSRHAAASPRPRAPVRRSASPGAALALAWGLSSVALAATPREELAAQRPTDRATWTVHEVFGHEKALRQEAAELHTDIAWHRAPADTIFWSNVDAFRHLEPLHRELAGLRREVAWLRRGLAQQGDAATGIGALTRPPPPPGAEHGRTLFLTMCAGAVYFDSYCGPFLASFERAYGGAATQHRVVVFTSSVDEQVLDAAKERFKPWAVFAPLGDGGLTGVGGERYNSTITGNSDNMVCSLGEGKIMMCNVTDEGVENRGDKVKGNNFWYPFHIAAYLRENAEGFCYAVIIDSDTLFVRPLGRFLPDCAGVAADTAGDGESRDWDVGFTVYDPEFVVPWADDPVDVGRTAHGFSRVNTGVVLLRLRDEKVMQMFLRRWAQVTTWLTSGGEEAHGVKWEGMEKLQWQYWHDELLEEFRGPNQAGLVLLICSYRTQRLHEILGWGEGCGACQQAVGARLELLNDDQPTVVRFRAFPARVLNHPESMPDGTFSSDLMVVHLKGLWWRTLLPKGASFFVDTHRRSYWNRDALALHRQLYEAWHFSLPPEARPANKFLVKDSEGNVISNKELQEALDEATSENF